MTRDIPVSLRGRAVDQGREQRVPFSYQPIISFADGAIGGYEALARPVGAGVESLLSAAAANATLGALDAELLASLVADAATLDPTIALFVNIEPITLVSDERVVELLSTLADGRDTVVELTERTVLDVPTAALVRRGEQLRAAGCCLALDDVGDAPRWSRVIDALEPEVLKVDVRDVDAPSMRALIERAWALDCEVVAERIETPADVALARRAGCTFGQGYLLGRPQDALPRRPSRRAIGAAWVS